MAMDLIFPKLGGIKIRLIYAIYIKNIPISAEFPLEQNAQWCPVGG